MPIPTEPTSLLPPALPTAPNTPPPRTTPTTANPALPLPQALPRPTLLHHLDAASSELRLHGAIPRDARLRKEALQLAKRLVSELEEPEDAVLRWGFELGSQQACLRLGIDMGVFRMLARSDHGEPVTAEGLAEGAGAEVVFVVRIMRVITSIGFAAEAGPQCYTPTPLTRAIATPALEATVRSSSNDTVQISAKLSDFFGARGYKCPSDSLACPFQWTFGTRQSYFEWIHSSPERSTDLNTCMKAMRGTRRHWIDWYPVQAELLADVSAGPQDVLMVDVGGGKGHDLAEFARRFPAARGRLVLQDMPLTLDGVEGLDPRIELLPHDFFEAQPIRGARAYYTHFVFHNWADDRARVILAHLKAAMTPGYSKLMLNESVMPDIECPAFFAAGDINMMSILAGMKRSRSQWMGLLKSVGFEEVRIWTSPYSGDEEGVVEVMVPPGRDGAAGRGLDESSGEIERE